MFFLNCVWVINLAQKMCLFPCNNATLTINLCWKACLATNPAYFAVAIDMFWASGAANQVPGKRFTAKKHKTKK